MSLAFKRVKVYLKLILIVAVVGFVLLVVLMNRKNTADIWVFKSYKEVSVLWLIVVTAVASVVAWWITRKVFTVIRELREVRKMEESQSRLDEQRKLADEMVQREKRIDEKVRRAITEES